MATLTPSAKQQFFDANGNPLAGGKLYTYAAGTTTPLATYTDAGGGTPNTNPVILDSRGEANIWLGSAVYKFKLTTSTDVELWTVDNIAAYNYDVLAALAASGGSSLVGFIQSGTGATARTVQAKLRDVVSVKDFGAVGNGVADDTTAIQAALNSGAKQVYMPSGTYKVSSAIKFPSEITIYGDGADKTNISSTYNGPIFASKNYFATEGISPSGDVYLCNFSITGDSSGANQVGILLRDYYSLIERVNIYNTLGKSIEFTHLNNAAVAVGGTLVNNRIKTIRTYGTGPCYLGADDNNKITDGVIDDAILSVAAGSAYALYIGSSAGWFVDKIHTEGNTPTENSVLISNAFHTNVGSIYCESVGVAAKPVVNFAKIQKKLSVASLCVRISTATAIAVSAEKSGSVSTAQVSIGSLIVDNLGANAVTGVSVQSATVQMAIASKTYRTDSGGTVSDSYSSYILSRFDNSTQTGTWTPSIYGSGTAGTYTTTNTVATYVRVGNWVSVYADIKFSAASSGSGELTIDGLPFAYSANTGAGGSIAASNLNLTASTPSIAPIRATNNADTRIVIAETTDNAALQYTGIGGVSVSTRIYLSFSYFTNAT